MAKIEQWGLQYSKPWDGYTAPELMSVKLVGNVYGHPDPQRHPDGKLIQTSRVVKAEGRKVTTRSGTVYELGEPHPDYVAFVKSLGRDLDPEQPIKVLG